MYLITLTHTPAEGTLADGTRRGDRAGATLHAHGFRFSRTLDLWYLPRSRDKHANTALLDRVGAALREAGYSVQTTIDNAVSRTFADAEADRAARAEERAERFQTNAENAAVRADARQSAAHQTLDAIPLGQPILIGHHSESADRRFRGRALDNLDAAAQQQRTSEYWSGRAQAAAAHHAKRTDVGVTLRRIERLEADERSLLNALSNCSSLSSASTDTGQRFARIDTRLAEVREELAYWREQIAAAEQAGTKLWSRVDFAKGDFVRAHGRFWHEVIRVNPKSLTIPYLRHPAVIIRRDDPEFLWTTTLPYHKVEGRMSARELADATQKAASDQFPCR